MTSSPEIARIARETKTIAVVGLSPKPDRPSHGVAKYLQNAGYRIIPVNPGHAGHQILGETVFASLSDIPDADSVDMIDIFRQSDAVPAIVDEALHRRCRTCARCGCRSRPRMPTQPIRRGPGT